MACYSVLLVLQFLIQKVPKQRQACPVDCKLDEPLASAVLAISVLETISMAFMHGMTFKNLGVFFYPDGALGVVVL